MRVLVIAFPNGKQETIENAFAHENNPDCQERPLVKGCAWANVHRSGSLRSQCRPTGTIPIPKGDVTGPSACHGNPWLKFSAQEGEGNWPRIPRITRISIR